ncbi:glycosyltransferase [Aureimonas sp. AU4]|uniref:glycosyltransferase n=1 Tax=Aureimonas sp. AU4 TaxID=1638163 RepID=UPI0007831B0C|nr:glycosyltransferase [Aureimonas sp. AU4]
MPKIAFVVTEDWFFASHFLPMARAAREMGLDVVVVTRVRDHAEAIEATGARIVAVEAERRSLDPRALLRAVADLRAVLVAERPDLVHCIALKSILTGGAAARAARIERRVFAPTGLGLVGARLDAKGRLGRLVLRSLLRGPLRSPRTVFLFENRDDPLVLGLDPADADCRFVGGAGIDPLALPIQPPLADGPLRLALVARMLWSKGVDTAVEAVTLARRQGVEVELDLFGAPDPSNPRAIAAETLQEWNERDGIRYLGPTRDVVAVWARHDAAILPSRGGEGLPRTLLESAACGRLNLTTDVPGCRSFVRDGVDGFVRPVDDVDGLAGVIAELAASRDLVHRLGAAAAARVRDGYTERDVMAAVTSLYRELLSDTVAGHEGRHVARQT